MASREPKPCGAASSEWTTSPPPFAAPAPLTPCRHDPANRAHPTPDPNYRPQTAYSSLSDADLWGKIRTKSGHEDPLWLRRIMASQPSRSPQTALRSQGEGWGEGRPQASFRAAPSDKRESDRVPHTAQSE